ncbi:MAG: serine/threonine protein kinase [Lachnospiraceae bacterium]|jgi:serine/threonine-protein kinase|nr:serine/threonine protein kinase [Lachnospiraceae bacterium]
MANKGTIIAGKYEVIREIGRGGMSIVYLGMDIRLNKQWAIKEIKKTGRSANDEVAVNSLMAEANLMKRLDHPALPRIVDIIEEGQTIFVVMDYVEGIDLKSVINQSGAQPQDMVISWAKQLCDALGYLHSQNPPIIYRDMKPGNVMLRPDGSIKVIDFGIAREYKERNMEDTVNLGTKGYAAPEQFGGHGQTDARTDIYGLGVTLYQLVTGHDPSKPPYEMYPIRYWNPKLSTGFELIIQKCTRFNPAERYQNCDELRYDLDHYTELDKEYKKKQVHKLTAFIVSLGLSGIFALTGVICNVSATNIRNSDYTTLTSVADATDYGTKMKDYKKAIQIYPGRTTAYLRILEAFQTKEKFGPDESDQLMALYSDGQRKKVFDTKSDTFAELNYQIGMMYFNYYKNADGDLSISECVNRAWSFFDVNKKNAPDSFKEKNISNCYYEICKFYRDYMLDKSSIDEASNSDYVKLFKTIKTTIPKVESAGAYDQLSLYNAIFLLLYDQKDTMSEVKVDKNTVLDLLKEIYDKSSSLTVQKKQSKELQSEIDNNYDSYVTAINRTWNNLQIRENFASSVKNKE